MTADEKELYPGRDTPNDGDNAVMFYARISGSHRKIFRLAVEGHDIHAIDELERTPIILATVSDARNVLALLRRGANIQDSDIGGDTPLHWAVHHKNAPVARLLLKKGADMEKPNERGQTPMHLASLSGDETVAGIFLAAKHDSLTAAFVKGTADRITVRAPLTLRPVLTIKKKKATKQP